MVVSDVNILCIGQRRPCIQPQSCLHISHSNRNHRYCKPIYGDSWKVIQSIKDVWYSVEPIERYMDDYRYDHELFDLSTTGPNNELLCAIPAAASVELLIPLIRYYTKQSPINAICFLLRLQEVLEPEIINT